jgi:uncharacterized protein YxjI
MGVLRGRRGNDGEPRRSGMRTKLASIGEDFWIEDNEGTRAYRVNGNALRLRDTFVLEVASGHEIVKAHGNIVDHEREIKRDTDTVAQISKRWFRVRDTCGTESRRTRTRPSCSRPSRRSSS